MRALHLCAMWEHWGRGVNPPVVGGQRPVGICKVVPVYRARCKASALTSTVVAGGHPGPTMDIFAIMYGSAADVHLPTLKAVTMKNNLLLLKNDFLKYLREQKLVWSVDTVESSGAPFVQKMAEVLWHMMGSIPNLEHDKHQSLNAFCNSVDTMTQLPGSKSRIVLTELETLSEDMFNILEPPWMSSCRWQQMKKDVDTLAKNLQKYAEYLKRQCVVVSANHEHQEPVRVLDTSSVPQFLPLKPVTDAASLRH